MSNVLLVEPNTVLAATYRRAFTHFGHSVVACFGAQTAIDAADKQMPDIVILELQLPGGHSGIEFLHEFRSYPEWLAIPVIVNTLISPQRLQSVHSPLKELGVKKVFYKPRTQLADLLQFVNGLVGQ